MDYDSNERIRKEKEREYSNIDSVKNEKNGRYGNNLRTMVLRPLKSNKMHCVNTVAPSFFHCFQAYDIQGLSILMKDAFNFRLGALRGVVRGLESELKDPKLLTFCRRFICSGAGMPRVVA